MAGKEPLEERFWNMGSHIHVNLSSSQAQSCLQPEAKSHLQKGITMLLSQWNALQMAIENEWGGHNSFEKSMQLVDDICSWFFHSKAPHCVEDLENLIYETMLLSLNTEIEDGSIEEIAEKLIMMHEDCLHGIQSNSESHI